MLFAAPPVAPPCVPAAARVVAARGQAAVYAEGVARFGCWANRRPVALVALTPTPGPLPARIGHITFSGHDVAYARASSGIDSSFAGVEVYDLRARRRLERHAAVTNVTGPESFQAVTALRLRHDAAVAWISTEHSIGGPPGGAPGSREVHGARHGHARLLDASNGIAVRSLRLAGRLVVWRDGGQRRQAAL